MGIGHVFPVLWTSVMALFQIVISTISILEFLRVLDILDEGALATYIKILYFFNVSYGGRLQIGHQIGGIPNPASVHLYETPGPAVRTYYFMMVLLGTNVMWLYSSLWLMVKGKQRSNSLPFYLWGSLAVLNVFLDIIFTVVFINDMKHTKTFQDLMIYVGGRASGMGGQNPDTYVASLAMSVLQIKGLLPVLFSFGCVFYFASLSYNGSSEGTDNDVAELEMGTIEPPRPDTDDEEIESPQNHQDIPDVQELPDSSPPPPPPPPMFANNDEDNDTDTNIGFNERAVIKFPPSLLSIPQQVEKIMSKNALLVRPVLHHRKIEKTGRFSPVASTSKDVVGDNFVSHGRRGTAIQLQSQLPWSYMPHSVNRVEDKQQKTENDVVPPVPVPDYTVHPTYRKASVHRADGWRDNWKINKSFNGHEAIDADSDIDENETIVKIIRRRYQSGSEEGSSQKKYVSATREMDILY